MPETARERVSGIVSLEQFKVDKSLKHSLPFPGLKSLLSSAIVLSFLNKKKKVIALINVLSRGGRAYILSQGGLNGFLTPRYDTLSSLLFSELSLTEQVEIDIDIVDDWRLNDSQGMKELADGLSNQEGIESKMSFLKEQYPKVYL